jgi:hypothetical protein
MLKLILALHVIGGATALSAMGIPLLSRKGGSLHRRAGWTFVAGMALVSVTALLLSGHRFLFHPAPWGRRAGLHLFYVAILTAAAVSAGVRVLRAKHRTGPHLHWWDVGLATLLTLGGAAMAVYALSSGVLLFLAYAAIGMFIGIGQLRYWLRPPNGPMHWWFEHMTSMLGACIAAVTAFLVINAAQIGLPRNSFIVWLTPTIAGIPITVAWVRYYRRRFERAIASREDRRSGTTSPASPSGISPRGPAAVPYMPSHTA